MLVISNAQIYSNILSGGDRILIECARRWADKGVEVNVITSEEGYKMFQKYQLSEVRYVLLPASEIEKRSNIYGKYVLRALKLSSIL